MDVSYFDTAFTEEPVKLTPMEMGLMEGLNQDQFKGFSYTNKVYTKWCQNGERQDPVKKEEEEKWCNIPAEHEIDVWANK